MDGAEMMQPLPSPGALRVGRRPETAGKARYGDGADSMDDGAFAAATSAAITLSISTLQLVRNYPLPDLPRTPSSATDFGGDELEG
jgi:hypothetical protein